MIVFVVDFVIVKLIESGSSSDVDLGSALIVFGLIFLSVGCSAGDENLEKFGSYRTVKKSSYRLEVLPLSQNESPLSTSILKFEI